ncbi:hypothetical protein [Ideonella sp. YS5]|uniref:hypothetical protein n=1 Tax=Ideonella sp. YS5 TaxID=3453714 RepID=UPI003EF055DD
MVQWVGTAGDIAAASTALGGLLLVFIGAISNSFDSFDKTAQRAVKAKFLLRGILALLGFMFSLLATGFALAGKLMEVNCLVIVSVVCLGLALLAVAIAASIAVWEIK